MRVHRLKLLDVCEQLRVGGLGESGGSDEEPEEGNGRMEGHHFLRLAHCRGRRARECTVVRGVESTVRPRAARGSGRRAGSPHAHRASAGSAAARRRPGRKSTPSGGGRIFNSLPGIPGEEPAGVARARCRRRSRSPRPRSGRPAMSISSSSSGRASASGRSTVKPTGRDQRHHVDGPLLDHLSKTSRWREEEGPAEGLRRCRSP